MKKIVEIAHDLLLDVLSENDHAVDFTCGQGYDTCFLAAHCAQVTAFDIQQEAIDQSERLLKQHNVHARLILDSHAHAHQYIQSFKAGIFNLGYLPHGDISITTCHEEVINALETCLKKLENGGRIVLVLYPGFEHGLRESEALEAYCAQLPAKHIDVARFQLVNRHHAPYLLIIDKH